MKKLFTIDDFMIAFVAALGYGYGETISSLFGWSELACGVASFVVGLVAEGIISKIAYSEAVQKSPVNRSLTYVTIAFVFFIVHYFSVTRLNVSMIEYLVEEFEYVVALPILGFIVNMLIRAIRIRMIHKAYGDGSKGYVFNVSDGDIREVNQKNQPIVGKYDEACAVKTRTGVYVGDKQWEVTTYLGIPYAKPPVGELRWKAPEPLLSTDAVYEAKHLGASAIQVEHEGTILKHHRQSEDCLSLNICVANQEAEEKKPVFVLFHHGDFSYGGSADPLLAGTDFVKNHPDIVFVSFNYRIGIFGFIDFSEVPGGEGYPDAPNLGLLDQIAALRWVKKNIAAFGGDPNRVTVIGFESGAVSISLLTAHKQAKGLFQRAFVFFGSPELAYDTPEASRTLAKNLLRKTQASTMEELIQLETEILKDAAQDPCLGMCAPTCDGVQIPADVYEAYRNGVVSGIEFIVGIPSDENHVLWSFVGNRDSYSIELEKKSKYGEKWAARSIYRSAEALVAGGSKVHLLYWNEKPLLKNLGSGTVDVAATLLGNVDALQMYGSVMNEDLSETLQLLLHKFVNGDELELYPNEIPGIDAIGWKAFPQALVVSDGDVRSAELLSVEALYTLGQE